MFKKNEAVTMKENVQQYLFKPISSALRNIVYFVMDSVDLLLGRRDMLTPPRRMAYLPGGGNSYKLGEEFLRYFIELGSLKPNETVLDIGSSIGRMAVPLTKYLDEGGSYEGFDIVKEGVDWCKRKISHRYPNFHFQLADVFNKNYNPEGKYKAVEYTFPYKSNSFDFVFLISVFTHMLPHDIENRISEIARVLRKDGRCLITFFLLNEESSKLIETKKSTLDLKFVFDEYRTIDKDTPEAAIAYEEQFIRGLCGKYGLNIKEPTYYGSWSGRKEILSYQDIIIATRG
jgi:SAM-dependent methyltransferase